MNGFERRGGRLIAGFLIVITLLAGLTLVAGALAKLRLAAAHPPPGELVDVGGYRMHLYCVGEGSPTVLLDAGVNDFHVYWASVQPPVARVTRACSYDRAGLGWSDAGPRPRSNDVMVEELHTLLANAGIDAPYILVGHSFGGINMRLFAVRYPDEVAGLVLVDSAHAQQSLRFPYLKDDTDQLVKQFRTLSRISSLGLMALSPASIPNRGLPAAAYAQYQAVVATTSYVDGTLAESTKFYSGAAVSEAATLGELPLIVLRHGVPDMSSSFEEQERRQFEQEWSKVQSEFAALSSKGRVIVARNSGHYVHLDEPELVVTAILELVDAGR